MARFGHSLPKEKLGGIGMPSWLPDWLTGKDVREIQGPVYIPPRGKAGGYRKELAADIARKAKDPFTQRDIQSAVIAGADVVPLMGEDVGIKETGEYWKKGDYINAAASGLGTVLGVAPVVGDVGGKLIKEGGKKLAKGLGEAVEHLPNVEKTASAVVDPVAPKGLGVRAYHGSPHSFDEFDISKIGTGEGAQAYGHGLYFAENEGVAKSYKRPGPWSHTVENTIDDMPASRFTPKDAVEKRAVDALRKNPTVDEAIDYLKQDSGTEAAQAWLKENTDRIKDASSTGAMYEVNIAADPEAFLDWDKPLSEQPELKQKLADVLRWQQVPLKNNVGAETTVSQLVDYLEQKGGKPFAMEELREAGIPGIKYLDQGSRTPKILFDNQPIQSGLGGSLAAQQAAESLDLHGTPEAAIEALGRSPGYQGTNAEAAELLRSGRVKKHTPEGSRNYVVFDSKLISIVKKYGLAAAISAGLISEEMGRQMQEQGEL